MSVAPTAAELIAAAKKAAGVTTDDDLARYVERHYGIKVVQSTVSRWKNDANGPGYAATIAMLDLVGWLTADAEARPSVLPADETVDHQAQIAAGVERLERAMEKVLKELPAAVQSPRADPKRKR